MMASEEFKGTINRTVSESAPWWPEPIVPAPGTPNVVVILLDDTGFAHLGSYGSPISTPSFDRLAAEGLRFTNFHTTALCSPTRACLLTGRNHHSVGMRALSNFDTGFPNMRGQIPASAATLAEILQDNGWATFCVGKWHLAPMRETSAAGPFTNWPLSKGFDRFYGFLGGETDQFHPELCADNHYIDPPGRPEDGYHLSEDLVDHAIDMVRHSVSLVPEKPFFLYLPFGATHAPHQAPDEYLAKYRGAFDEGWDVWRHRIHTRQLELGVLPADTELAPRNPGVRPWDELDDDEQAFACRLQEAFAAFLEHTDAQTGRLIDALERLGVRDDTMVVLLSDNGASQEGLATGVMNEFRYFNAIGEDMDMVRDQLDDIGTRRSFSNYPWGWAQVGNTPAKRYKQNTHGGGVRDPLIISWPNGIDGGLNGQIRSQFHHVIDIAPTILEVCGYQAPDVRRGVEQQPIAGTSLAYCFQPEAADSATVPTRKGPQYFEMFGHRAVWSDGWKAVTFHDPGTPLDDGEWELYHIDEDFSECHDLAAKHPEKLAEMVELFWAEAERHGVLPISEGMEQALFAGRPVPGTPRARDRFIYYPPLDRNSVDTSPPLGGRSWRLTAEVERSATDDGVLLALGTVNNGLVVYLKDGHLVYDYNHFTAHTVLRSPAPVPVGRHTLEVQHTRVKRGPARTELIVNGEMVATGAIPELVVMISSVGMDIGRNPSGICDDYDPPFEFSGTIHKMVIDTVRALPPGEEEAREIAAALINQ